MCIKYSWLQPMKSLNMYYSNIVRYRSFHLNWYRYVPLQIFSQQILVFTIIVCLHAFKESISKSVSKSEGSLRTFRFEMGHYSYISVFYQYVINIYRCLTPIWKGPLHFQVARPVFQTIGLRVSMHEIYRRDPVNWLERTTQEADMVLWESYKVSYIWLITLIALTRWLLL